MTDHEAVIDAMASVKGDVKKRTDEAIAAILLLAWAFRQTGFSFEDYPELDEKVNKLLQALSDGNLADAEKRAKALLEELGLEDWEEAARKYAAREIDGENAPWRLDLHASHLKELLAGWIAVAAAQKLSLSQTRLLMNTYGGAPWLSKKWRESGLGKIGWGSGYQTDVVSAMTVIGQDLINQTYQYAKVHQMKEQGVTHYRTIRGSTYDCPLCDEMTKKRWPIDEVVLPYHPRCVCIPVPIVGDKERGLTLTDEQKAHRKAIFDEAREKFKGMTVENVVPITITTKGIKETLNQPHVQYFEKNELVLNLPDVIRGAKYVERVPYHKENYFIVSSHILEIDINGRKSYIVARESRDGVISFYSISDNYEIK